ncbi:hypothetical protein V8G54_000419 [Vigna mungo]|uniref:Transmembrane protein n=1 Tax=Vigna mungo TaxID=3915 RepID=A0AAQ3P5K8_VIGMU
MVRVASYFAMTLGAFVFWHSMDKVHVWIALHQDEKQERLEKEAEIRRVREELLKQQANQKDEYFRQNSVVPSLCCYCCIHYREHLASQPLAFWPKPALGFALSSLFLPASAYTLLAVLSVLCPFVLCPFRRILLYE